LEEWLDCARKIDRRGASALRNRQAELHVRTLPLGIVYQCSSRATLTACDTFLRRGPTHFCQPPHGQRRHALQTALIVAIANRIAQLDRAEDHASIGLGPTAGTNRSYDAGCRPHADGERPSLPGCGAGCNLQRQRAERGFATGFPGRETSRARPSRESPAMTASSKVRNIPLSQLVLAPANVRKTPATAAEDTALEASIRAKGILQNLIVHAMPIDGNGVYQVVAGGRRLKVLQKLAAEGVIDADTKVPCKVEQPEDAVETSLAENTVRAAMHPADEFAAMAALIDGGVSIDAVATRFGTSERHVHQRLRLGKLAPELLDAFRAGDISLEVVTAFTLGADHAAQLAVWRQLKDHSYIQPYTVKRLLTETAVALDSDLAMFVGAEAYEAAGGTITRDLFSGDDDGFMDDAALVRRLAIEKLEAKAAELRPQWAWTKAVLDPEYGFMAPYTRLRPQPAEVPADIAAEIERIEQRLGRARRMRRGRIHR
jgi:ParB/RepB/Spo0J family partition protein